MGMYIALYIGKGCFEIGVKKSKNSALVTNSARAQKLAPMSSIAIQNPRGLLRT